MKKHGFLLAGMAAGVVNGLFGAGGGMVLIPLLTLLTDIDDKSVFPASISMILPMTLISVSVTAVTHGIALQEAIPYLIGGAAGGTAAGILGRKIPVLWLHRILGSLILMGGIRYLC